MIAVEAGPPMLFGVFPVEGGLVILVSTSCDNLGPRASRFESRRRSQGHRAPGKEVGMIDLSAPLLHATRPCDSTATAISPTQTKTWAKALGPANSSNR